MNDLQCYVFVNSISVILGRWDGVDEWLFEMEHR